MSEVTFINQPPKNHGQLLAIKPTDFQALLMAFGEMENRGELHPK